MLIQIAVIGLLLVALGLVAVLVSRQLQQREYQKIKEQWTGTLDALRAQGYTVTASQFHGADLHLMRGGEIALAKIETRATPAAVRELAEVVDKSGHPRGLIIAETFPREALEEIHQHPKIEALQAHKKQQNDPGGKK